MPVTRRSCIATVLQQPRYITDYHHRTSIDEDERSSDDSRDVRSGAFLFRYGALVAVSSALVIRVFTMFEVVGVGRGILGARGGGGGRRGRAVPPVILTPAWKKTADVCSLTL